MGSSKPSVRGFGLFEAIVALAILAGTGLALFAWIGQNLRDLGRMEEAQARASLQLAAQGLVASVNPVEEPQGERRVGGLRVRWRSELIEPLRPSLPFTSTSVRWQVALYMLDVQAVDADSGLRSDFSVERAGLERVGVLNPNARGEMP